MPHPADQNAGAQAEDAGQPQLRRRRDLRRADGSVDDAWTGTMPAVTPSPSRSNDADKPLTRRTSWAEAAAAADATKPSREPSPAPAANRQPALPDRQPASDPAGAPIASVPSAAPGDAAREAAVPPSDVPAETPSFRRSRPTVADAIADSPMPDFISSPGLFVKEQKPRPVGGIRGALYRLSGGAWNLGPGPKQRQEDELARRISRQLQGSYNTAILSLKGGIGKTSITVGVGLTLAEYRGDAPCAIDSNPTRATWWSAPWAKASTSSLRRERLRTCWRTSSPSTA